MIYILCNLSYKNTARIAAGKNVLPLLCIAAYLAVTMMPFNVALSATTPACPDPNDKTSTTYPEFAMVGDAPNFDSWKDLASLPSNCHVSLQSPARFVVALAGRFVHAESVDEIAQRLGAISKTEGLAYWSASDRDWRTMLPKAYALESDDKKAVRKDFDSNEVLSGQTLYSVQKDNRTWGLNRYGGRTISWSDDHLIFLNQNTTPVRFGPLTVLKAENAQSVLFFTRHSNSTWQLYILAVIKDVAFGVKVKSLINRQAAVYRHMIGIDPTADPPLDP